MSQTELKETINASLEKTWEVLFNQYGDIHIHNPTMEFSEYLNGASKGELNCVRHCKFNQKLSLDEKITEVTENKFFKVEVEKHNLPLLKDMAATYELTATGDNKTEVKMVSSSTTSPGFMIYLMRGQLAKSLKQHLFGLKYYVEMGKTVNNENYAKVFKSYK